MRSAFLLGLVAAATVQAQIGGPSQIWPNCKAPKRMDDKIMGFDDLNTAEKTTNIPLPYHDLKFTVAREIKATDKLIQISSENPNLVVTQPAALLVTDGELWVQPQNGPIENPYVCAFDLKSMNFVPDIPVFAAGEETYSARVVIESSSNSVQEFTTAKRDGPTAVGWKPENDIRLDRKAWRHLRWLRIRAFKVSASGATLGPLGFGIDDMKIHRRCQCRGEE